MNIDKVMTEVAHQLGTITGLRVYDFPQANPAPPAAIVCYPNQIVYDETYQRGYDMVSFNVGVLVGRVSDRAARRVVAGYAAGSGPSSIKAVLESGTYSELDTIKVASAEFDVYTQTGQDYLAMIFEVEITGRGE